jgi:acetyl-CoA carboxylase carboxyltransferase component
VVRSAKLRLCGKASDPRFVFAWPNAKYAVMGAEQASDTLFTIPFERNMQSNKNTLTPGGTSINCARR